MASKNDDDFDKFFGTIMKFGIAGTVISAIIYLGAFGLGAWAVVSLVLHFT